MRRSGRRGIFVGACGFSYDAWDGLVFPAGLPKSRRLARYAELFSVVEIDSTYYGTPPPGRVARWAEQTPEDFTFIAKVPRQVTQEARLAGKAAAGELARFLETMRLLGPRLGSVVFQMSPGFRYPRDYRSLVQTIEALPQLGGADLDLAVELRHPSWLESDEPAALLRAHGVAWVWNDWQPTERYLSPMPRAIDTPAAGPVTSDAFAYIRLIGSHDTPVDYRTISVDRLDDLVRWAALALEFRRGREDRGVYVLLNNHYSGSSPATIRELERLLDLPVRTFGPAETHEAGDSATQDVAAPTGQPRLPGL